jgi:import inner membrane translocase subunit TIM21
LKEAASDGQHQAAMMNRVTVSGLRFLRPVAFHHNNASTVTALPSKKALILSRQYATQHQQSGSAPESRRRAVTPFNDDGHVPWTELSAGEKTARAAQQTFNFGMVIVGLVLTV